MQKKVVTVHNSLEGGEPKAATPEKAWRMKAALVLAKGETHGSLRP
jgi:hypothetical protein